MKDTLREQIKAYISLATFKHSTALKDAGFQMDMDAIVDQLLSIIEEEKNNVIDLFSERLMYIGDDESGYFYGDDDLFYTIRATLNSNGDV